MKTEDTSLDFLFSQNLTTYIEHIIFKILTYIKVKMPTSVFAQNYEPHLLARLSAHSVQIHNHKY